MKVLTVRMDEHLYEAFKVLAHEQRVSANLLAVQLMAQAIAGNGAANALMESAHGEGWQDTGRHLVNDTH